MAMTPVWTVDPHPHAPDAEGSSGFRRHEIAQFPGGMRPLPWNQIDPLMRQWTDDVKPCAAQTPTITALSEN